MVPYSQIPLALHVRLIQAYEHETGFRNILEEQYLVDENNLKSIIRNYRLHWKQRLLSMRLYLPDIPSLLWSSIFVTLMANKIGGLQFGIYRNCQISSRVFHTAVAALPLTKANRSDFE